MPSRDQVDNYLKLAKEDEANFRSESTIAKAFVTVKCCVDRWNLSTDVFLMHPDHSSLVKAELVKKNWFTFPNNTNNIWGATLCFSEFVPHNLVIALDTKALESEFPSRAVGIVCCPMK